MTTRHYRRYTYGGETVDLPLTETVKPARTPSLESDVAVPMLQAVFSAIVGAGLGAALAWAAHGDAGLWAVIVGTIVLAGSWLQRLGVMSDLLHSTTTEALTDEPDPDPPQGQLVHPAHILSISPYQGRANQRSDARAELRDTFAEFVRGCERDTSARYWQARISREKYQEWRDLLIGSGWAAWRIDGNPRAGWRLTCDPDQVIAAIGDRVG